MKRWVNFRELKQRLDFLAVLQSYKVTMKTKGKQSNGPCPLPTHPKSNGKSKSPSFSVNLERGIWQCFSCKATGNVIEFAARMEGLNPDNPVDFRNAALLLQERFAIEAWMDSKGKPVPAEPPKAKPEPVKPPPRPVKPTDTTPRAKPEPPQAPAVRINTPLDFQLRGLDSAHPYLAERGLRPETIDHFGLGYCARGLMAGRIAIPLHDLAGKLIGYAGRLVDERAIDDDHPKYKLPGDRKKGDVTQEFRKSLILYNAHTISEPTNDLIIVEGFPSVWWLWQAGYGNVVSLMGSSCSSEQTALIIKMVAPAGHVWILPDGDDAGDRCGMEFVTVITRERFVRWIRLPDGRQPTDYQPEELAELLGPPA